MKADPVKEWLMQADYDLATARAMFTAGRHITEDLYKWLKAAMK